MKLKKPRTCLGCYCNNASFGKAKRSGWANALIMDTCSAGYKTEKIDGVCGFYGKGKTLIGSVCKPVEPCPKPMTQREEVEVMRAFYDKCTIRTSSEHSGWKLAVDNGNGVG